MQSSITGDNVEMERSPVCEQQRLGPTSAVSLNVSTAKLTVVYSQFLFSLDHQNGKSTIILILTKRASRSPVLPTCAAARTREEPYPPGVDADQLRHRRE